MMASPDIQDKRHRPRAIVRAGRAVWRWLAVQDDSVIEQTLGVISLFVLLFAFVIAPVIAGWQ